MADPDRIDTLLIDRGPGETRIAALANDAVIEVYHHRSGVPGAGALYRGRVGKRLPDASAVFIDIGLAQPAFMSCGSSPPVEGSVVDVRVIQPPRGTKGAKVAAADPSLVKKLEIDTQTQINPPACLAEAEHPVEMCCRLYGDTLKRVRITPNDPDHHLRQMLAPAVQIEWEVVLDDLFFEFGVDEAVEQALTPEAPFTGGGKLIIEPTAALVAIDVDAGPMTATRANAAAVQAVAREVRLRALAGPMIIDLIPSKGRSQVMDELKSAVESDPVPTRVSGFTPEGRLEMNRRRARLSLAETLLGASASPAVDAIAYRALRRLVRQVLADNATSVSLKGHARVVEILRNSLKPALAEAEERVKCSIALSVVPDCPLSHIDLVTV